MGMREAMLLKLNGVEEGIDFTQHSISDVLYERHELGPEDTHCQVRTIRGMLAWKEVGLNLRPSRIGCHGDKKVSSTIITVDGQGILTELLHVASAASERGGQYESCTQLIPVSVSIGSHCIC